MVVQFSLIPSLRHSSAALSRPAEIRIQFLMRLSIRATLHREDGIDAGPGFLLEAIDSSESRTFRFLSIFVEREPMSLVLPPAGIAVPS